MRVGGRVLRARVESCCPLTPARESDEKVSGISDDVRMLSLSEMASQARGRAHSFNFLIAHSDQRQQLPVGPLVP